jgi:hypothetical protein
MCPKEVAMVKDWRKSFVPDTMPAKRRPARRFPKARSSVCSFEARVLRVPRDRSPAEPARMSCSKLDDDTKRP